jgi:hypothetical protein
MKSILQGLKAHRFVPNMYGLKPVPFQGKKDVRQWLKRVCENQRETAGPSTSLRSGRDDTFFAKENAKKTARGRILNRPTELSSRPKRSEVEGPAVSLPVLTHPLRAR